MARFTKARLLSSLLLAAGTGVVLPVPEVQAQQRIFLPTWHVFRTGGTYLIPDRGTLNLGGVHRRSTSSRRHGLPGIGTPLARNRSFGQSSSASGATARATIHDLRAMDEAILGRRPRRSIAGSSAGGIAERTRRAVQASPDDAGTMSLAEIRRRHAAREKAARKIKASRTTSSKTGSSRRTVP